MSYYELAYIRMKLVVINGKDVGQTLKYHL